MATITKKKATKKVVAKKTTAKKIALAGAKKTNAKKSVSKTKTIVLDFTGMNKKEIISYARKQGIIVIDPAPARKILGLTTTK